MLVDSAMSYCVLQHITGWTTERNERGYVTATRCFLPDYLKIINGYKVQSIKDHKVIQPP